VVARVQHEVPWRPGARDLLDRLHAAEVPCALVTMSYERFVAPILDRLPRGVFRAVVTGDAVSRGKPDPEPYLTAARLLAVDPTECVAIEDSNTGATSAAAAGCAVLVVPHHVDVPAGPGRSFRESLVGLGLDDLAGLVGRG
jgi:HAD superfamily hydrolase (TIGR01509 family)